MVVVMSTLSLDDFLYKRTAEAAAAHGMTVDAFVAETLRAALERESIVRATRSGIPTLVVAPTVPLIDPQRVQSSLAEEGF